MKIYKGNELEVRLENGEWIELSSNCEYRVKPEPEVVHYCEINKRVSCGSGGSGTRSTNDKPEVTCPDCLKIMKENKLPDWCKVGGKCFYSFGGEDILCTIIEVKGDKLSIYGNKRNFAGFIFYKDLTPAKFQRPTLSELEMMVPFGVRDKENKAVSTVFTINNRGIHVAMRGGHTESEFFDTYTQLDGSEFGEWVKP